jgi:hypothetical protein
MMINPHELSSYSHGKLDERHTQSEMARLARITTDQTDRARGQRRSWVAQILSGLLARLRVARLGISSNVQNG